MKRTIILFLFGLMTICGFICSARETYPLSTTNSNTTENNRPRIPQLQNTVVAIVDGDTIEINFSQSEGLALINIDFRGECLYRDIANTNDSIIITGLEGGESPLSIVIQTSIGNVYEGLLFMD